MLTEIMIFRELRESIQSEEDAATVIRISRAQGDFTFLQVPVVVQFEAALKGHGFRACGKPQNPPRKGKGTSLEVVEKVDLALVFGWRSASALR
ncbi:MAG: hypothetical protein WCC78_13710 [Terriglobales bacterium]